MQNGNGWSNSRWVWEVRLAWRLPCWADSTACDCVKIRNTRSLVVSMMRFSSNIVLILIFPVWSQGLKAWVFSHAETIEAIMRTYQVSFDLLSSTESVRADPLISLRPIPLFSFPPLTSSQDYISALFFHSQFQRPSIDHPLCPNIPPIHILLPLLPQLQDTPRDLVSSLVHLLSSPTIRRCVSWLLRGVRTSARVSRGPHISSSVSALSMWILCPMRVVRC
jgi:hypothetical protein